MRSERPDAQDALDALDATCLTRTQFAMVPCIRTQLAMASAYWTQCVRAFSFWTQPCQCIFLLDAAVSGHFPSGRSRVRANGIRMTRVMAPWLRWLSRHGTSQQILMSHSQTRSGFQHSDSVQFYSLCLMYINICYYHTSRFQHKHPVSHPSLRS